MGVETMVKGKEGKLPKVSVAMVSYQGKNYIKEQIESVMGQLGKEDELVISDDGSTDGAIEAIKEFQKKDPRIRLLKGPGKGIKKNVEHAIRHTRGEYIFLADQDDIWCAGKVGEVLEAFEREHAAVVVHDAIVFEGEDPKKVVMDSFFAFRGSRAGVLKNIAKNSYIGCCMAFRRELKRIILPIPAPIEMHDQWIGVLGDYFAGKSCFLHKPLLLYRRHGDNNSSMKHYGIGKMLRNRLVFFVYFFARIIQFRHKSHRFLGKFKKNDD